LIEKKGQPGARSLSLHFCKRLFPGLELITSWSQGNSFTAAPGLLFNLLIEKIRKKVYKEPPVQETGLQ
jgi:hypothetical protein